MRTQKLIAENTRQALTLARNMFGPEVVVLGNRRLGKYKVELEVSVNNPTIDSTIGDKPTTVLMPEPAQETIVSKQVQTDKTKALEKEVASLKRLLLKQTSQHQSDQLSSGQQAVLTRLESFGLNMHICNLLTHKIDANVAEDVAWEQGLQYLVNAIPVMHHDMLDKGGYIALAGPAGVGKTTLLGKLATQFFMRHGASDLGIISTDSNRAGAREQLTRFGRVLGVDVINVNDRDTLLSSMDALSHKKLVFIDTAGVNIHDDVAMERHLKLFANEVERIRIYMVLSATMQYKVLTDYITHLQSDNVVAGIMNKIDACEGVGEIVSAHIKTQLPVSYLNHGQRMSSPIESASREEIVKMLIKHSQ